MGFGGTKISVVIYDVQYRRVVSWTLDSKYANHTIHVGGRDAHELHMLLNRSEQFILEISEEQ